MTYGHRARMHGILRVAGDCRILCTVDGGHLQIPVRWRTHRDAIGRWRHRSFAAGGSASGSNAPPLISVGSISEEQPPLPMRSGNPVTI